MISVKRNLLPLPDVEDALRLIHTDWLTRGVTASQMESWLWGTDWFPHLKWHPRITRLTDGLPGEWKTGRLCDPQIVLQFPHVGTVPKLTLHTDVEPPWAGNCKYLRVVGVPLSPWRRENGSLRLDSLDSIAALELEPGSVFMMSPDQLHTASINYTGAIRYGVYFRWLEDA